jgi:hypothetical protein
LSLTQPTKPSIPYSYSQKDYDADLAAYNAAIKTGGDATLAKTARNSIAWGLMGIMDELYNNYSARLFSGKGALAVAGDSSSLGLTAATVIAKQVATKTIFGALGTAVAGFNLSVDKNVFAQQTYEVIALAMETRRTALFNTISDSLSHPVADYPLSAVKRDLILYFYAGSLPGGLQEIQKEASNASADTQAKTPQSVGAPVRDFGTTGANQPLGK